MIRLLSLCFAVFASAAVGQQTIPATSGDLRVLDKVTGQVTDLNLAVGTASEIGHLRLSLQDCRAPRGNPNGDAYALLTILYRNDAEPAFRGWMIASAPALNAMDHPRYDVWVLRCNS